jgi:hypothetical protein
VSRDELAIVLATRVEKRVRGDAREVPNAPSMARQEWRIYVEAPGVKVVREVP